MLKFRHPSTCIIVGCSQAGKTSLARRIIKECIYDYPLKIIKWCYSIFQPWYVEEKGIEFVRGFPKKYEDGELLVIDDMMNSLNDKISELFTTGSHHRSVNVILILQNLFPRCRVMRDISLNTHYVILFKNNRDVNQVMCFARQAFPQNMKYFMDSYKKATSGLYKYLVVDLHPNSPDELRLRESLFPDQQGIHWVFVPEE